LLCTLAVIFPAAENHCLLADTEILLRDSVQRCPESLRSLAPIGSRTGNRLMASPTPYAARCATTNLGASIICHWCIALFVCGLGEGRVLSLDCFRVAQDRKASDKTSAARPVASSRLTACAGWHKRLSCRRETARRSVSVEILSTAVNVCEKSHL